MKTEIEAKWLEIDHDEMAEKIKSLGGELVLKKTPMIRTIFDTGEKGSFIRVRDESNKVTLTYKRIDDSSSLTGTKEICLEVDDYDTAVDFIKTLGFEQKSIEETKREIWMLDGAEIALDEWPWLPPFMEIEAPDEKSMLVVANKLGLNMKDAMYSSVDFVYEHYYDVTTDEVVAHQDFWKEIRFSETPKELEAARRVK